MHPIIKIQVQTIIKIKACTNRHSDNLKKLHAFVNFTIAKYYIFILWTDNSRFLHKTGFKICVVADLVFLDHNGDERMHCPTS